MYLIHTKIVATKAITVNVIANARSATYDVIAKNTEKIKAGTVKTIK